MSEDEATREYCDCANCISDSESDHEYDSECDCDDCVTEPLDFENEKFVEEHEKEPSGGGNCIYYHNRDERMYCINCNIDLLDFPIRACNRKLVPEAWKTCRIMRYCNAHYEPAFNIWLCHGCGEVHEYNGEPRVCHKTLKDNCCAAEMYSEICIHCGTKFYDNDIVCKIQDRTKCECDKCMTLYSKFRNNKTKSARK